MSTKTSDGIHMVGTSWFAQCGGIRTGPHDSHIAAKRSFDMLAKVLGGFGGKR